MDSDGSRNLEETKHEKDLGIILDNKLRFKEHAEISVNKANEILGIIRRSYTYLNGPSLSLLYKALVRPILEYGHVIRLLNYKKDLTLVKNVQQRAAKRIPKLKEPSYTEGLLPWSSGRAVEFDLKVASLSPSAAMWS